MLRIFVTVEGCRYPTQSPVFELYVLKTNAICGIIKKKDEE